MIETLVANAVAGRGFWIGLFTSTGVLSGHVTLAHLGRKASPGLVQLAYDTCTKLNSPNYGAVTGRVWAVGRMDQKAGSVVAAMLEGDRLHALRNSVVGSLQVAGIRIDDTFEFHPHLTIRKLTHAEDAVIPHGERTMLNFGSLSLVCGEARVDLPLGDPPF